MSLLKVWTKKLNERPTVKLFLIFLLAVLFIVPAFVYVHNFEIIQDVDRFIAKDFQGGKITKIDILDKPTSRSRYRRIEIDRQESPTYPVLVTDFYSDTLIAVGQTIWKEANSKLFTIRTETTEMNYELNDQRMSRRIELIIMLIMAITLITLLTFLNAEILQ